MGGVYGSTKLAAIRVAKFAAEVPAKVAKELAPMLDERVRDMFTNEADPYGNPWAPLSASTLRRKKGNGVILYRVGLLGNGSFVRYAGRKLAFTYGPSAKYAQDGDQGRGNRPPRLLAPTFGPPKSWLDDVRRAQTAVAKRGLA